MADIDIHPHMHSCEHGFDRTLCYCPNPKACTHPVPGEDILAIKRIEKAQSAFTVKPSSIISALRMQIAEVEAELRERLTASRSEEIELELVAAHAQIVKLKERITELEGALRPQTLRPADK